MNFYKLKISTSNILSLKTFNHFFLNSKYSYLFKKVMLPKNLKRFVILKSPHVNSKSKEHFQFVCHQRLYYTSMSLGGLKDLLSYAPNDLNIIIKKIKTSNNLK
jgi:ribosomal protein S10